MRTQRISTDIPPTISPEVPIPCKVLAIKKPVSETENAIAVIDALTDNPPIEKRRYAGTREEIKANKGPQIMFTKLLIEAISAKVSREILWASASRGPRLSKLATRKKFKNSEQ